MLPPIKLGKVQVVGVKRRHPDIHVACLLFRLWRGWKHGLGVRSASRCQQDVVADSGAVLHKGGIAVDAGVAAEAGADVLVAGSISA